MDAPTVSITEADRRRLWDRRARMMRRAGLDRRYHERRDESPSSSFVPDRRARSDRRRTERRGRIDRRIRSSRRLGPARGTTPVPYSPQEAAELRARFVAGGPVTCPACGSRFTLGPLAHGGGTERLVLCQGCGRAAVVSHASAAKVLVVSAARAMRDLLFEMLASAGHEVVEADDGRVGLDAFQALTADVVIVDTAAAGRVTPQDFVRRMRRTAPDARIIALAARPSWAGYEGGSTAKELGDIPSLKKPVSRDALLDLVRQLRG